MSAATPVSTADLLAKISAHMDAVGAAASSGTHLTPDELADAANGNAGPRKGGKATPPRPVTPPVGALKAGTKIIVRPNGEAYHVRPIGDHDDVQVLREARDKQMPILMYGLPGCGKTALFEAAFTDGGFEYVGGSGDTMVADFIGSYVSDPTAASGLGASWVDGPLLRAMKAGVPLLVDEVALIDPKVMSVVYGAMDGRNEVNVTDNPAIGLVKAAKGFVVFGACNPNAPGANMSEALVSRFAIHIEVSVDFKLLLKLGVDSQLVTIMQNMQNKYVKGHIGWYPQIREALMFTKVAALLGVGPALSNLVSQAPEDERPKVADLLTRGFGIGEVKALRIG